MPQTKSHDYRQHSIAWTPGMLAKILASQRERLQQACQHSPVRILLADGIWYCATEQALHWILPKTENARDCVLPTQLAG
jgi:hypothetical protein